MNELWFGNIPSVWIDKISPLVMIVVGFFVEKRYISRPSLFINSVAVNVYFTARNVTNPILIWYANIGFIIGIIAIVSYIINKKMPSLFYAVGLIYSSLIVGTIILVM